MARSGWLPSVRLRLSAGRYRFRESLFLLPAVIILLGAVTAEVAVLADRALAGRELRGVLTMDSNAATWLLATVAGATITTAGVVFSLTVVSLQLASSQFSPRVMRSFIRDRLSQVVIGVLVATFVHCVLTLRHLSGDPTAPAPPVSLTVTVALAVGTVLLIVVHLDHLARHLQVGEVVRTIAAEGDRVLTAMTATAGREVATDPDAVGDVPAEGAFVITAPRGGWVTQALSDDLMRMVAPGTVVRLDTRTGAYVHAGEPLVTLWPSPDAAAARGVAASIGVADARTMQEDVDFAIRQLVDVGLRALSPAVNDPTTAVEVVLRIGGLLRTLLVSDLPPEAAAYRDGRVLLRPWNLRHDEYLDHAVDQLRLAGVDQPLVMAALLRVLRMLVVHVEEQGHPEHVPALRHHLTLVAECIERGEGIHPADIRRLLAIARSEKDPADHSPADHPPAHPAHPAHLADPADPADPAARPTALRPTPRSPRARP